MRDHFKSYHPDKDYKSYIFDIAAESSNVKGKSGMSEAKKEERKKQRRELGEVRCK